ncbi:hypothetical protein GQ42DRAFT_161965 [Ramicandelaber brevisporus]|nr:hypothetical protein GQ42DRAFT_161965 [Ramicandelaber brevisporus]
MNMSAFEYVKKRNEEIGVHTLPSCSVETDHKVQLWLPCCKSFIRTQWFDTLLQEDAEQIEAILHATSCLP